MTRNTTYRYRGDHQYDLEQNVHGGGWGWVGLVGGGWGWVGCVGGGGGGEGALSDVVVPLCWNVPVGLLRMIYFD